MQDLFMSNNVSKKYVDGAIGSNIGSYVPYLGATQDVNIGAHNIVVGGSVISSGLNVNGIGSIVSNLRVGGLVSTNRVLADTVNAQLYYFVDDLYVDSTSGIYFRTQGGTSQSTSLYLNGANVGIGNVSAGARIQRSDSPTIGLWIEYMGDHNMYLDAASGIVFRVDTGGAQATAMTLFPSKDAEFYGKIDIGADWIRGTNNDNFLFQDGNAAYIQTPNTGAQALYIRDFNGNNKIVLDSTGNTNISGNLITTGSINSPLLVVNGTGSVTSNLRVGGNTNTIESTLCSGGLVVNGIGSITGNTRVDGQLSVQGAPFQTFDATLAGTGKLQFLGTSNGVIQWANGQQIRDALADGKLIIDSAQGITISGNTLTTGSVSTKIGYSVNTAVGYTGSFAVSGTTIVYVSGGIIYNVA